MPLHRGRAYVSDDVSLMPPDIGVLDAANSENPEDAKWRHWREEAVAQEDIYYFAIHLADALAGEIFLHDIDLNSNEALLGYRVFASSERGRGTGRKALQLLLDFVGTETNLRRLVILTGQDNILSRRIAERCGFNLIGPSWESDQLVVYDWFPPKLD